MAFDLTDEELQATREMNKTAWKSEIDKWSKEYLIERYKDLEQIEKEHKKENGELREEVLREKEKNRQSKMRIVQLENEITARIEDVNKYFISKDKIKEIIEKYKCFKWKCKDDEYWANRILDGFEELLEEGDDK